MAKAGWDHQNRHTPTMNQKELKELIEFLIEKDISEFEPERGDVKVRIKRGSESNAAAQQAHFVAVHPAPVAAPAGVMPAAVASPAAAPAAPAVPERAEEDLHIVHS